jgi:hypothetical protein
LVILSGWRAWAPSISDTRIFKEGRKQPFGAVIQVFADRLKPGTCLTLGSRQHLGQPTIVLGSVAPFPFIQDSLVAINLRLVEPKRVEPLLEMTEEKRGIDPAHAAPPFGREALKTLSTQFNRLKQIQSFRVLKP